MPKDKHYISNDEEFSGFSNEKSKDQNVPESIPKKKKLMERKYSKPILIISIIFIILVISSILTVLYIKYDEHMKIVHQTLDVDTFYEGIFVQGIDLSNKTMGQAKEELKLVEPGLRPKIAMNIKCAENLYELNQDSLDFNYTTDEVLNEAFLVGRTGKYNERYEKVLKLKEEPAIFNIECSLDDNDERITEYVNKIKDEVYVEAKAPYISSFKPDSAAMFTFSQGKQGREMDSQDLANKIKSALQNQQYTQSLQGVINTIPIPVDTNAPSLQQQTQLISQFSTVSTNKEAGNINMSLALKSVNGKTYKPDEIFSFNKCTGDTTTGANGYQKAGAIVNDEVVDEYGGGICQASTTIYGAVLRADLAIVARNNHKWPSTYVPIGQDATVSYPSTDFKFKNTSKYPIFIKSWMSGKNLTVQIYGYHPTTWDTIEVTSTSNAEKTYATGNKVFYKGGSVVKTEAILPSQYQKKQN